MKKPKIGSTVRVLAGVYAGRDGKVQVLSDAPKSVGVLVYGGDGATLPLTWFKPEEVEELS